MYMPDLFAVNDRQTQINFIRTTGWGYLTGVIDDEPYVTHLPFLVTGGTGEEKLVAHMARANPHWESFANGKPQLVVFPGPHTYITPSWYNTDKAVPTWNYTTAHVYGTPVVIDDPQTVYAGQQDLVNHYEAQFDMPWRMEDVDTRFHRRYAARNRQFRNSNRTDSVQVQAKPEPPCRRPAARRRCAGIFHGCKCKGCR